MATKAINNYSYDRNTIKAGILHFGVGNFHRDHLKFMTSHLLEDSLTAWMADLRCHDSAGRRETLRSTEGSERRIYTDRLRTRWQ